jgi:hypothetical protein
VKIPILFASSRSTAAEHLSHNPKIEGSNPATGSGREKINKKVISLLIG